EPQFYAWVASAFILAQVVGLSVAGAWKDRAGVRTPFLLAVAGFGIGSLLCALAPSMHVLVFARAFQGLSGGALNALSFAAAAAAASPGIAIGLLATGVLAAYAFWNAERHAAVAVIPRETWLGRGPVGSSLLAMMFYTGAYTGAGVFLPLYLVQVRGESTTAA